MFLTESQFDELWRRLYLVCGLQPPSDDRKALCMNIVREKIDPRAIDFMKHRIDQQDGKPRNIAKFFLALANQWKSKNPEMQQRPSCTCAACDAGTIYMLKPHPWGNGASRTCGTCGHCQPGDQYTWTKQSIEAHGMEWLAPGWMETREGYIWPSVNTAPAAPRGIPKAPPLPYNPNKEMTR